jgi:hypothetical protein
MLSKMGVNKIDVETPILISPNWDVEFHVLTNASLLVVGVMLAHNLIGKHDHPIVYAFILLNNARRNYNTIKCEGYLHWINSHITLWATSLSFMLIMYGFALYI